MLFPWRLFECNICKAVSAQAVRLQMWHEVFIFVYLVVIYLFTSTVSYILHTIYSPISNRLLLYLWSSFLFHSYTNQYQQISNKKKKKGIRIIDTVNSKLLWILISVAIQQMNATDFIYSCVINCLFELTFLLGRINLLFWYEKLT